MTEFQLRKQTAGWFGHRSTHGSDNNCHVLSKRPKRISGVDYRQRAEASRRFVLPSGCADHPFCTAVFCSPRRGRRCFAFPCFALPRRHCSTPRPTLDCQLKCLDDQPLGRFLPFLYFPDLLLARDSLSICSDWYVFWSPSWLARFGNDPLGKPTGRTFLHSEPLARASRHAG